MKNFVLPVVCILFFSFPKETQAQGEWKVGIGAAIVKFVDKSAINGENYSFQIPRFNITKQINKRLSVDGAISFNSIEITEIATNDANYFSIDTFLRYSLMNNSNFIDPYVFIGASLISVDVGFTPAVNSGFGGTLWVFENFGINGQVTYKLTEKKISHFQLTGGLVYNLDSGRRTLWNIKR